MFRNVECTLLPFTTVAITGHNGSGKSTLLQLIWGYQTPSEGSVSYYQHEQPVEAASVYKHAAFVAPYLELPEELTLCECLEYHFSFKELKQGESFSSIIAKAGLAGNDDKQIRYFSSGMKQRLKLLLAFFCTSPVLFLDEPTSNLDESGIAWYQQLLAEQHHTRTIVIASNQKYEYELSDAVLDITQFSLR